MIASFGDLLTIHSVVNGEIVPNSVIYDSGRTSYCNHISWAGNGKWLVGPIEDPGVLPVLKYDKNKLSCMRSIINNDMSAASFFNCTNKEVIIGSKTGTISLWNVKEKKMSKCYNEKLGIPVKFIEANRDDKHIAACGGYSSNPIIKLYGVTTNQFVSNLELGGACEVSDLRFSPINNHLLGCSALEGNVVVFDLHQSKKVLHAKDEHEGACTSLAMSPINHNVVVSVSMTGSLVVHDLRQKKTVLWVNVGSCLTAVDMLGAEYAALGTRAGHILLFDLRKGSTVSDVVVSAEGIVSVRCFHEQTVHSKFSDLAVNTPEEPVITTYPLEMSVSELCTPPMPTNHHRKSGIRLSAGNNTGSPHTRFQSTPNVLSISQDSFMKMLESPAAGSPIDRNGTPALSQIREDKEESVEMPAARAEPVVEMSNLALRAIVREEVREIVGQEMNNFMSAFRTMVREEVRDGLNGLVEDVKSMRVETENSLKNQRDWLKTVEEKVTFNKEVIYGLMRDVDHLGNCIQYLSTCFDLYISGNSGDARVEN